MSKFQDILKELESLHASKDADYAGDIEYGNIRASLGFGISPWVGAMIRLSDKVERIKQFVKKGKLNHEGVRDSLVDIANYAAIATVLYDEDVAREKHDKFLRSSVLEDKQVRETDPDGFFKGNLS